MDWFLIVFTFWPPHVQPMEQKIPQSSEARCIEALSMIRPKFVAVEDPAFRWSVDCGGQKREESEDEKSPAASVPAMPVDPEPESGSQPESNPEVATPEEELEPDPSAELF